MGIKDLWTLLNPYCERKPLYELQGKVVAVDLAGWVCESLCVVDYDVQARFYLRNLFFRTCYLLLSGVTPVFVLEGTAPALKYGVIAKRNEIQFRGAAPRKAQKTDGDCNTQTKGKSKNKGRTRFNYVQKQCEELIMSMGLECVQGPGEAEAFCAQLNAVELVDGVISQDSDCFAYGAKRVYRNFSVSTQGNASANGGAVDVYDIDVVKQTMDFGQNKMIAMALLCGCDYCPEGVGGVGRDAVTKLFNLYSEPEILDRLRSWRLNDSKYTALEMKVNDKTICVNCGHHGRVQQHAKSGCGICRKATGCDSSLWKDKRLAIKAELLIRNKAMNGQDFPSQAIIDEFLQKPLDLQLDLNWKQPNPVKFLRMMGSLLQWEEIYCFQKILPLLTRWQLFHFSQANQNLPLNGCVWPDFIKKKRAPKGVPSYEIVWKDEQKCFEGLISDEQLEAYLATSSAKDQSEGLQSLWSTIEPIDLVEQAYPELVEKFLASKAKKKPAAKARKPTKRGKKNADSSVNDMSALSNAINELDTGVVKRSQVPAKRKKSKNTEAAAGLQMIDKFIVRVPSKSSTSETKSISKPYQSPKIKTVAAALNLSDFAFDLDDTNDGDLSQIINDMIVRPPNVTEFAGRRLRFDYVQRERTNNPEIKKSSPKTVESRAPLPSLPESPHKSPPKPQSAPHEVSMDEFDLLVLNKQNVLQNPKPVNEVVDFDKEIRSSTPILMNRFLSKHQISSSLSKENSPSKSSADENVIVSSFFGDISHTNDDQVDAFERSINFKDMPDEPMSDSSSTTSDNESLDEVDIDCKEHNTLNCFLSIDDNYKPVGGQSKK